MPALVRMHPARVAGLLTREAHVLSTLVAALRVPHICICCWPLSGVVPVLHLYCAPGFVLAPVGRPEESRAEKLQEVRDTLTRRVSAASVSSTGSCRSAYAAPFLDLGLDLDLDHASASGQRRSGNTER